MSATKQVEREMAKLRAVIYGRWIEGGRRNDETPERRAERHRLTDRWYELRRQLRRA